MFEIEAFYFLWSQLNLASDGPWEIKISFHCQPFLCQFFISDGEKKEVEGKNRFLLLLPLYWSNHFWNKD